MDLKKRFGGVLRTAGILRMRGRILIACSGGPDSVALACLLVAEAGRRNRGLGIAHLHHGLRGCEADRDRAFVAALARKFKVSFYSRKADISAWARREKESIEETARKVRYDFLYRTAVRGRYRYVALGHTREDQAETVLMRVLQGTGLRGLAGIRRSFKRGKVIFVRPLLDVAKREILSYLKENAIAYRRDSSNRSPVFLRNRIRRKLLPWIAREINPRIVESLARIPDIVGEEIEMAEALEKDARRRCALRVSRGRAEMKRDIFLGLHPPLQFRLLDAALKRIDPKSGLNFDAWRTVRRGLSRKRFCHSLPRDIDLVLTPSRLTAYKKKKRG